MQSCVKNQQIRNQPFARMQRLPTPQQKSAKLAPKRSSVRQRHLSERAKLAMQSHILVPKPFNQHFLSVETLP